MSLRTGFLTFWIGGLVAFAIVIAMHLPLVLTEVPGGIGDHQAAGTAAEVNRIQTAWERTGLLDTAKRAMLGDLVFIGIYGLGSILAGFHFRRVGTGLLKHLGTVILIAGLVFTGTDYGETIAQFIQLSARAGDDALAGFAASVRPFKMAAWIITFFGVLVALFMHRKQRNSG